MKKSLLIATSALVGLTAVAVTPVNEMLTKADDLKESSLVRKETVAQKSLKANVEAGLQKGPAKALTAGDYTLHPFMSMPTVPFYMNGLIMTDSKTQEESYVAPLVVPVNTPVKYGATWFTVKANSSVPDLDRSKVSCTWNYLDFNDSEEKVSNNGSLVMNYPASIAIGSKVRPELTFAYDGVSTVVPESPFRLVTGGTSIYPLSDGVTNVGFNTCAEIGDMSHTAKGQWDYCQASIWGTGGFTNRPNETYTDISTGYIAELVSDSFKAATGQDLKSVEAKGFGYNLPYPGSPYLLSSLSLYTWSTITEQATVKVDIYEADADGYMVGEPLYSKTCTVVPTANETPTSMYRTIVTTDLTSKDEDGFDLNYIVVDKPLFVLVSGFVNNPAFTRFYPWAGGYASSDINSKTNARVNHFNYGRTLDCTAWNVVDLIGAGGTKISNYQDTIDYYIFGQSSDDSDWTTYYCYKNFFVEIAAEFPYLQPTQFYINSNKTDIKYSADGNYVVDVPTGTESLDINIATSSTDIDEIVIDDEEVVAGVEMKVADGLELIQEGYGYNFIELQFKLDKNFVDKSFTIPVMYKNQKINLTIKNGSASVNEIVVDGNVATQYYDLQGRKVTGTPEKGIYIVKEGNKARKVVL